MPRPSPRAVRPEAEQGPANDRWEPVTLRSSVHEQRVANSFSRDVWRTLVSGRKTANRSAKSIQLTWHEANTNHAGMNAHSKLAGHHVVAVALLGGLLFLGSNAASQPATITKTPGPQPTTPAPASQPAASDVAEPSAPAEAEAPAQTEFTPTTPPEAAPPPPPPDEPEPVAPRGPFSKGAVRLTLLLGTASTYNDTYFIIGGGVGYYRLNGLEVGLDYEAWLFANPVIQRLSPEVRYVFHMVPVLKPYVGTFYRRNFVVDHDDYNQVGGRVGGYFIPKSNRMFIGAGAVYERTLDCTSSALVDCDSWYPEISIGVSL